MGQVFDKFNYCTNYVFGVPKLETAMERMIARSKLNNRSLKVACGELAAIEPYFAFVIDSYGTPPLWDREPGFATLLHIILEQQVSLASAKACFDKLNARLGRISPENVLTLDDAELKAVGFSRQKAAYVRHLAEAVINGHIDLDNLHERSDEEVKGELVRLKGVGAWTSDIYLLMVLLRPDIMPRGDIALHESYRKLNSLDRRPSSDEFIRIAERWKPYRSAAARLLWHCYLSERRKK